MITKEEALLMGTNAPKAHQRIIARLTTQLGNLFYSNQIALEPLPETMLDEGQTSPTPDVILYDNDRSETPVIIEIAHTDGARSDIRKVQRLIEESDYGIVEGFVYDYKKDKWHKCKKDIGKVSDAPSYCDSLQLDLASLLRP